MKLNSSICTFSIYLSHGNVFSARINEKIFSGLKPNISWKQSSKLFQIRLKNIAKYYKVVQNWNENFKMLLIRFYLVFNQIQLNIFFPKKLHQVCLTIYQLGFKFLMISNLLYISKFETKNFCNDLVDIGKRAEILVSGWNLIISISTFLC